MDDVKFAGCKAHFMAGLVNQTDRRIGLLGSPLGEMIGADPSNQFFLTTHNPYLLAGIVQKTPIKDLALFVCSRDEEGSTLTKLLSPEDVSKVVDLGASVFFNLGDFIGHDSHSSL